MILSRRSSDQVENVFDLLLGRTGYLAGHVGGYELTGGLAMLLDNLIEGIDYPNHKPS